MTNNQFTKLSIKENDTIEIITSNGESIICKYLEIIFVDKCYLLDIIMKDKLFSEYIKLASIRKIIKK